MQPGYLVPRGDGRYVLGATMEEQGFDTAPTAGGIFELLRDAIELVPGVGELAIEEVAAGLRPGTPDNAPVLGAGALDGLHWAAGCFRHGILLAPIVADALAATLAGEELPAVAAPFARRALRGRRRRCRRDRRSSTASGASCADGATVADAVALLGVPLDARGVAVAVDREVVRARRVGETRAATAARASRSSPRSKGDDARMSIDATPTLRRPARHRRAARSARACCSAPAASARSRRWARRSASAAASW